MPATCRGKGTSRLEGENSERALCHKAALARMAPSGNNNVNLVRLMFHLAHAKLAPVLIPIDPM